MEPGRRREDAESTLNCGATVSSCGHIKDCVAPGMPSLSQTYKAREPDFTSKDLSRRIGLMLGQWGGLGRLRMAGPE